MPLSIAIITRNAAGQLERCLASVAFAEEVVVVDSGSTDDTVELAARHGARVIRKEWLGFGAQKQFAVDAASHEWVLCVDADESLSSELREAIVAELKSPRGFVYAVPRRNRFLGRWLKHRGDLLHDSAETLEKYLDKQNRYTSLQAESLRAAGRRANALQLVLSPLLRFIKFYLLRLGFLDGVPGLVHVTIGCMNSFNKYAKLKALERASE